MVRERRKWRSHEAESTDGLCRGGQARSSVEAAVMVVKRRGLVAQLWLLVNCLPGGTDG